MTAYACEEQRYNKQLYVKLYISMIFFGAGKYFCKMNNRNGALYFYDM